MDARRRGAWVYLPSLDSLARPDSGRATIYTVQPLIRMKEEGKMKYRGLWGTREGKLCSTWVTRINSNK